MSLAADLATILDGQVVATDYILVRNGDRVDMIECRPTGRIYVTTADGRVFQLGGFADGAVVLADRFRAAVMAAAS